MTIQQYLDKVNTLYKTGNAREHSYRGDLQNLIMAILPDILVTNEPARVECGAPDYVLTRKDIPVGYIEAKDIGVDLADKKLKEQFDRYKSGLSNLIFTDYLDFHFYKDGEFTTKIEIATIENGVIVPQPQNFEQFTHLIQNFAVTVSQTIKSPSKLAEMMAGKAKLMADVIAKALDLDDKEERKSNLKSQMLSFQLMLIHDIDNKAFADIYSQTIAYGMFAARYHDPSLENFSRTEAAQLIPKSNPFLRKLFQDIAGFDLDDRLVWIVDELVNIFLASDVAEIMKNFGKSTKQEDPVVHFYETFLGEYNPALRKARGVWYTPQPVVNFIVRAVDDILKTEFDLPQGLANTSKIKIKKKAITQTGKGANSKIKEVEVEHEVHRVQILDPATGTGTFLAEVVKHIYKKFEGQQGIWSKYVTNDLIPRLNGFEILMASYAMAHLKMDMLLTETGYKPTIDQRFRIFLTNSLEEAHPDSGTLFSSWLSEEADQANAIKRDTPVMCIIGNPPYSGISSNNGVWISKLIDDYKYVDGVHFNERKHWLNDDYVKFLRYGQHFIEKNGSGVLAFINPHGFLDNPTFRGMRWHLLKTYDKIYTIDLHGNSKKKETAPDGSADVNVFDIMQGVSINIFVKTGKKKVNELGKVFHYDLFGKRELKYSFLSENSLKMIDFKELKPEKPNLFFVPKKENKNSEQFFRGFKINEFFINGVIGTQTGSDKTLSAPSEKELKQKLKELYSVDVDSDFVKEYQYRPFETRFMYFLKSLNDNIYPSIKIPASYRSRFNTSKHLLNKNIALLIPRQIAENDYYHSFVCKNIADACLISNKTKEQNQVFPLYLYPETNGQQTIKETTERTPNLNIEIVKQLAEKLQLTFTNEKEQTLGTFAPIDVLDYIYAVLHSPTYRETYKEFLKIDFPRVPYPTNAATFWQLVKLGGEIRKIHLLESPIVEKYITQYPEDGDNVVTKPIYKNGSVYINDTQHFANVPEVAWNFYIGGYQPAQKWLKDRKDRELSFEDILHYQKIIVALFETDRIMKEIDKVEV